MFGAVLIVVLEASALCGEAPVVGATAETDPDRLVFLSIFSDVCHTVCFLTHGIF